MFRNISAFQVHLLKCNQVCELSSSESVAGNGQDLAPALCASHQRMAIALANLEVKEAAFAMGGEEGTATLALPSLLST